MRELTAYPLVRLDSFILSNTPFHVMQQYWGWDKTTMEKKHILFQEESPENYIQTMMNVMIS